MALKRSTRATRRRALDRESLVAPSREPSETPPDRNHLAFSPTKPHSQGFRLLYRHNRQRRFGSPWVGPIKEALKRFKLTTVTPGATSTLSASSSAVYGRLFLFPHPRGHSPLRIRCCTKPQGQVRRGSSPSLCEIADDPLPRSPSIISPFPSAHVSPCGQKGVLR